MEKGLQAMMQNFTGVIQSNYQKLFGNQMDVLGKLSNIFSPILSKGPNQRGFSPEERAARTTTAINSVAAANKQAQQASRNFMAGQGGGAASGVTSGIADQINASINAQSANLLASEQSRIEEEDWAKGSAEFAQATGVMENLGQQYSPNAAMTGGISAGSQSFEEAKTITEQQNQEEAAIAGGITSLATTGATMGLTAAGVKGFSFGA
jgi:hypothetical protein